MTDKEIADVKALTESIDPKFKEKFLQCLDVVYPEDGPVLSSAMFAIQDVCAKYIPAVLATKTAQAPDNREYFDSLCKETAYACTELVALLDHFVVMLINDGGNTNE